MEEGLVWGTVFWDFLKDRRGMGSQTSALLKESLKRLLFESKRPPWGS